MTSKTTNKFSPEVRTRAVRWFSTRRDHPSRWATGDFDCREDRLAHSAVINEWVKKAETDKRLVR